MECAWDECGWNGIGVFGLDDDIGTGMGRKVESVRALAALMGQSMRG